MSPIIEGAQERTYKNAGAPTDGEAGTYAGVAAKGALLVDTTNAKAYVNTGTQASPTWSLVGLQS